MRKSPIDELFYELYGFYPNKAGSAYEIIVASAIKIISGDNIKYNQHLKGIYSESDYQLDGLNIDKKQMIEAKDYTINKKKVGRDDLQKLQGALSDLDVEKGIFASATDYTKPAKKYSESTGKNPLNKEIELYNIRESTKLDEKGRINKFEVTLSMITPDFKLGKMNFAWTNDAIEKFKQNGLIGKPIKLSTDRFYNEDGSINCLIEDFTYNNQPIHVNMDDEYGEGCWLLPNRFIKYENELYGFKGIEYKIPYKKSDTTFTVESDGQPKILIKSEDGNINKLLTDEQFRKLTIENGEIK
ncbi:restriction endonuclease [Chryseobacterium oryzae]|uniref:Restriction endonuclease n=1 Tax=Chryseobacterium oryzae TaxID=2929799 RepID=A0ABY4BCZ7_9FLAO|nr:restriction endonuclease [Chryseobacterium oryzae]UOE37024.1 restriction endonuclease [Chryseobacterium oryzae]